MCSSLGFFRFPNQCSHYLLTARHSGHAGKRPNIRQAHGQRSVFKKNQQYRLHRVDFFIAVIIFIQKEVKH